MKDVLQRLNIPEELSRQKVTEIYAQGLLGLVDIPNIENILKTLGSAEVQNLVESGKITFAMVKPELVESVSQIDDLDQREDHLIAERLIAEIEKTLEVVFSASFVFTDKMIEVFYGGVPKENQLQVSPIDENRYGLEHQSRWDEFKALMRKGPVTGLIIYSENGKTVEEWRNIMGNDWQISRVKKTYPNSLRARYGVSNHNNIFHGSDSVESVEREIRLFADVLREQAGLFDSA